MGNGYHSNRSEGSNWIWLVTLVTLYSVTFTEASKNFDYEWRTGPWGSCEHSGCGFGGSRTRTVTCSHKSGWTTLFSHCHYLPIPSDTEPCFKVCDEQRDQVTWVPSTWSPCEGLSGEGPCVRLAGIKKREVPCVHINTQTLLEDRVCEYFQPKPPTQRPCELRCVQDCVVSPFSDWSECEEGCFTMYSRRVRRVLVAPRNGGRPCPPLAESMLCNNCSDTYRFQVGKWSPCHKAFQFKNPKKKERSHLLIGYQDRDILCVNSHGNTVGHRYCLDSLHLPDLTNMQSCTMPQDCFVSDWMEWRPINSSCLSEDGQIIPGYMSRIRRVRQMPQGDSGPCPPLTDTFQVIGAASTLSKCPRYEWVTSNWSDCELLYQSRKRAEQCGPGIHIRVTYCMKILDGREIVVDSSLCRTSQPLVTRQCHIPCTQNCSISHWSDWSDCRPDSCSTVHRKASYRYRYRRELQPQGGFGLPCPHLSESQPCIPVPCVTWNITATDPCEPRKRDETCGPGTQRVSVTCQDKNATIVEDDQCLIHTRVHKKASPVSCYRPCPDDCIVSGWTAWSKCSTKCSQKGTPALRRRTRVVYAKAGPGGKVCPSEEELSQVEMCPTAPECQNYIWQTSDWGSCAITKRSLTCGTGVRSRSVQCYRSNGAIMPDGRCSPEAKPADKENCSVPCPVDCYISDWSDWSACSATCQKGFALPRQIRQRYVIEEGSIGGRPCPTRLLETRPCQPLPFCTYYHWSVTEWSQCVLPPSYIYCGPGLQARGVSCQDEGSNETFPDFCLRHVGPMPAVTQPCFVRCDQECKLSSWSAYGRCVEGCDKFRIRTRNLLDESKPKDVCRNQEKYPLAEKEICRCSDFKAIQVGGWSQCLLEDIMSDEVSQIPQDPKKRKNTKDHRTEEERNEIEPNNFLKDLSRFELTTASPGDMNLLEPESVKESGWRRPGEEKIVIDGPLIQALGDVPGRPVVARRRLCGMGTKYRLYVCQSQIQTGVLEPALNCSYEEYSEEMCIVPCPVDCEMSGWTQWTPCSVSCGYGIQTRERHIVKQGQNGGQVCPALDNGREVENQTCHSICKTNTWRTSNWSQCFAEGSTGLNKDVLCGIGIRTRLVECVKKADFYGSQRDSEFFCRSEPRPFGREICEMPCPGKCVVSDWSVWSQCPWPCSSDQFRSRSRQILRYPLNENDDCPPLTEEEPCIKGHNCFEFKWRISDWSSCILDDKSKDCGVGWKHRFAFCELTNGTRVDRSKCEQLYGSVSIRDLEACNKTCDVNCAVSEWSAWSSCSRTCGLGEFTRKRTVLYPPVGRGRQCPQEMEQMKPCFLKACYSIVLSEWTLCQLKKGACGHGEENRTISCVSEKGLPVDLNLCADEAVNLSTVQTSRMCSVPCPGECQALEWSEWSPCYISCQDYHQGDRAGIMSRSRVVILPPTQTQLSCPPAWEYKQCSASDCFSFFWRNSEWRGNTRQVWCSRNDGLNVTGGCDENARPPEELSCSPPCSANNSVCVDTNLCGCKAPYSAVYDNSPTPLLLECVMGGNGTSPTAAPALYFPLDGPTNFWMYAVLAAGTLFIVFVVVALYTIWRRDRKQTLNADPSGVSVSHTSKTVKSAGRSPERKSADNTLGKRNSLSVLGSRTPSRNPSVCEETVLEVDQNPTYISMESDGKQGEITPLLRTGNSVLPSEMPGRLENHTDSSDNVIEDQTEKTALLSDKSNETVSDVGDKTQVVHVDIHAESEERHLNGKVANKTRCADNSSQQTLPSSASDRNVIHTPSSAEKNINKPRPLTDERVRKPGSSEGKKETLEKGKTATKPKPPEINNLTSKNVVDTNSTINRQADKPVSETKPVNAVQSPPFRTQHQVIQPPNGELVGKTSFGRTVDTNSAGVNRPIKGSSLDGDKYPVVKDNKLSDSVGPLSEPTESTGSITLSESGVLYKPGLLPKHNGDFSDNSHSSITSSEPPVSKPPGTPSDQCDNSKVVINTPGSSSRSNSPCVVIDQDSLDSDSDLPESEDSSVTKLPLADSRENLAEIITTV